jgi:acyl-CoA-dependent ceramide synthase
MVWWSVYAHAPLDMAPGCYLKPSADISPNANATFVPMSQTAEFDALGGNNIGANLFKAYTDREGPICWNPTIRFSFLVLLLALQAIICLWFAMIVKVVYKVVSGQSADDVRSDDEDEDETTEKDTTNAAINAAKTGAEWVPVGQEVGVEALSFAARKSSATNGATTVGVSRKGRRSTSRASGISIPGHGDRKELLGRIGCDKPS